MNRTRKHLAWLVSMLLLVAPFAVGAEETLRKEWTISLEGQEEPYPLTLFRWEGILSLWYAAEDFAPVVTRQGLRFELIDNQMNAPVFFSVESLYDPAGEPADLARLREMYQTQGWTSEPWAADGMLPDFHFGQEPVQGMVAHKDRQIARVLVTDVTGGRYVITLQYPQEASEGWGARMVLMVNTLRQLPGE